MKYIIALALIVSIYAVSVLFGAAWGLTYMAALCVVAVFYIQAEISVKKKIRRNREETDEDIYLCKKCGKELSYADVILEKCTNCKTKI